MYGPSTLQALKVIFWGLLAVPGVAPGAGVPGGAVAAGAGGVGATSELAGVVEDWITCAVQDTGTAARRRAAIRQRIMARGHLNTAIL
jgi:hypothetical protein